MRWRIGRKQVTFALAALVSTSAAAWTAVAPATATAPSIIIGVNDGSGWGAKDATDFRERGFTSERLNASSGTGIKESTELGWTNDAVIVGNTNDEEPLSKVNVSKWTEEALAQVKEEAAKGVTLLEVGNEMYLKGACGAGCYQQKEPAKYAEMFVSLSKAVEGAKVEGVKLLFDSYGDYEESKEGPWSQVCCGGGWLATAEKAQPELRQRVAGFTMHPYGEAGENKENDGGPGALWAQHEQAVALGFENTEYYLTEYGAQVEGEVNSTSLASQKEKIKAVYEELVTFPFVRGIWYYQTHDDTTGKWGLIEKQESGESPFVPRPSLEVVESFALTYEGPTTESASSATASSATLNGTINPEGKETSYFFEYGKTTSYGTSTSEASIGSGSSPVQVSKAITGLSSGSTYHFRLVAKKGTLAVHGADRTFVATATSTPANTTAPSVSGTPQQNETVTAGNGVWTNEPTGYSYQWQRCNGSGGECVNVAGAAFQSYKPEEADIGHTLVVKVTATNNGGAATASSAASANVKGLYAGSSSTTYSVADQTGVGREETFQFAAKATATVEEMEFRTNGNANTGVTGVVLGIFAESSGKPGAVLGQATVSGEPATSSWIKATGLSIAVTSGTKYWLAVLPLGTSGKLLHYNAATASGGAGNLESIATGLTTLTEEGSWETYNQGPVGFQALGAAAPAPIDMAPPTISGTAQQGQTLTEAHGSWRNEPTSYAYKWQRCNSSGGECTAISGATSQTYVPVAADVGHTLRVQETASDAGGSSGPETSGATAVVLVAAPENTVAPSISGTAQQGQVLTANHGTWTNEPTSYSYQWARCNSSGAECANISGATSSTYTLAEADIGHTLVAKVTATNAGGSNSASSSATSVVQGLLIGDATTTYSVADQTSVGREETFQFTAKVTGKVEEMEFRTNATANTGITGVYLGIFAESSGKPGTVLGQAKVSGEPATSSWIKVTGLSISLTSGTKYWLAVLPLGTSGKLLHYNASVSSGGTGNLESIASGLSTLTEESSWETYNQGPVGFQALGT